MCGGGSVTWSLLSCTLTLPGEANQQSLNNRHASLKFRKLLYFLITLARSRRNIYVTALSNWNVMRKLQGFGGAWPHVVFKTANLHTQIAVRCAYEPGAADTWLGYISALVTMRHEARGGNHGSRDFCQRCTPVIAEVLSCNLKHISEQIHFQPGVRMSAFFGQNSWNFKLRFWSEPGFGPTSSWYLCNSNPGWIKRQWKLW